MGQCDQGWRQVKGGKLGGCYSGADIEALNYGDLVDFGANSGPADDQWKIKESSALEQLGIRLSGSFDTPFIAPLPQTSCFPYLLIL